MKSTPRNYWMVVTKPEHFRATREHGFTVLEFESAHQKKAQRIGVGDRILFFVSEAEVFGDTATVDSAYAEDRSPVGESDDLLEIYPLQVRIHPDVVLKEEQYIDARLRNV